MIIINKKAIFIEEKCIANKEKYKEAKAYKNNID
jgi:hypothetical protein